LKHAFRSSFGSLLLALSVGGAAIVAACGGGSSQGTPSPASDSGVGDTTVDDGAPDGGDPDTAFAIPDLQSLALDPATATLTSTDGGKPTQAFTVLGKFTDGSMSAVSGATFTVKPLTIGTIDSSGVFTASGRVGGDATITASKSTPSGVITATATVTVNLERTVFAGGTPVNAATKFGSATVNVAKAPGLVYPLDQAVMPQNVYPADVQWTNGTAGDVFKITFQKPHFTGVAYVMHSGVGFKYDWLVDAGMWQALAQTDPDAPATLKVDRFESATATTIAAEKRISITFAKAALTGSVYYWDIAAGRIQRIDDGTGTAVSFMPTPPPSPVSGERCVGCHSVSNDGRYMFGRLGGGDNVGAVFDLTKDLSGATPPVVYPINAATPRSWFSSWSPDSKRLVVSFNDGPSGVMRMYDTTTGGVVAPVSGTLPTGITHPTWSRDGKKIAYVTAINAWGGDNTTGDIALLDVNGLDTFGATKTVHTGASLSSAYPNGVADSYPSFTPDSARIVFAHGTGSRSDVAAGRVSALFIMNADGTNVMRLDNANGGAMSSEDFQPRFSPFDQGGYFWVSFLSRRDYGNAQAGTKGARRQQIWVAAIKKSPAAGAEPSMVGYWLPGQNVASQNISAFWTPRACRADGDSCSVGSECCGGDCRADGSGKLVCSPPPPSMCRQLNQTCSTDADCCDGRPCTNNVCIDKVQ
jgi:hypothetical protein